ncbi:hypothetical protein N9080_05580 [Akkermansiaceae bacterium]|nr:hypothetical protein [Akkermansiaceae bacterium]
MKNLLLLLVSLLLISCGPDLDDAKELDAILEEALPKDKAQLKGPRNEELYYEANKQEPYTGWLKRMHANGQVYELGKFKDGKSHGPVFTWYENGQKSLEVEMKDGKVIAAKAWLPDGLRCPVTNIQDGTGSLITYDNDGKEDTRHLFEKGMFTEVYQTNN